MNTNDTIPADPSRSPFLTPKGNSTVMLVDDDPAVLMIGKAILSTLPYTIVGASSGEDAIEKLKILITEGNRPDVIILDLTMPGGMSGLDTLQEIRLIDARIGIIACSGFFEQSAHDLCVALGFMECIEKPYTSELLTSVVRKCVTKMTEPESVAEADAGEALGPLVRSMAASSSRALAEA